MTKDKLRDIDLNLIVILEAILRSENISRAADDLNMSQSAVSHALKRLRSQFEDPLFIRSRDRMVPTPKAAELSDAIFDIMRLTRSVLLPSPSFDPEKSDRPLILSLGDVGDMRILPLLVKYVRQYQADIQIISRSTEAEDAVELLENGKLDLYIGTMETTSSEILCQKLYEDRLVVITSNDNPLRDTINFDQYAELEHVKIHSRTKSKSMSFISDLFMKRGLERKVKVETPYILFVPIIVESDDKLCASIPISLARYFQRNANINILKPEFDMPRVAVNQYWHRRFTKDPFILWIRQAVYTLLRDHESELY